MKTVTGKVISTTPISLSKAASILSKFVSADTGASQAVCAYLRRSSFSFNELSQFHRELKSHRKYKIPKSDVEKEKLTPRGLSSQPELSREPTSHGDGLESERNKNKKKKEEGQIVEGKIVVKDGGNASQVVEASARKKQKKRKSGEMEEEEENHVEELRAKKKRKRKTEE